MYARFVRLFFLVRYDIPFWSLNAQQNLVLCAKLPKGTGVQNTSVDKNYTRIDHSVRPHGRYHHGSVEGVDGAQV